MIKVKKRKILLLPGDGIGPEVMGEVKKIINWFNDNKSLDFEIDEDLAGGCSYDKHGTPITDEVFYKALESAVVMLGAVGGPKWDSVEFSKKPERALLKLRKELKLFANLRPAICFEQLVDASTLKPEIVSGLDIMIVRELTGGIYFGEPRGIKPIENGERKGINTHTYTSSEIVRVARVAPSASLGAKNKDGEMRAMYEPIHGSAPDIAGKGIANPIASILSFAMALRYSLDLDNEADSLEKAVQDVLNDGLRTKDILSKGKKEVSTSQMGDAIISKLQ
ncbi:MAG: hypothetical protein EBX08_00085 [Proteobacteria bacterium]|nr:hypothetical protein [Pseudomonadota bacterium]